MMTTTNNTHLESLLPHLPPYPVITSGPFVAVDITDEPGTALFMVLARANTYLSQLPDRRIHSVSARWDAEAGWACTVVLHVESGNAS